MEVVKYSEEKEGEWNAFVQKAKNGHFMFLRGYMEYHAHRFQDESLMFYRNQKLVALLPAHLEGKVLASHKGLTFGGIICGTAMTFSLMREVFSVLQDYLWGKGITVLLYKAMPVCYHQVPASEDVAVLTLLGARMIARDLVSVVNLSAPPVNFSRGVQYSLRKAQKQGLTIQECSLWSEFMDIMTRHLNDKYNGLKPAHTAEEMIRLVLNFPDQIKLLGVYNQDEFLGGGIFYLSKQVVHAQYLAMNSEGKRRRALPFLIDYIFNQFKEEKQYFSFGTSQDADYINESLYYFKESMGARAMLQETYLLTWQ